MEYYKVDISLKFHKYEEGNYDKKHVDICWLKKVLTYHQKHLDKLDMKIHNNERLNSSFESKVKNQIENKNEFHKIVQDQDGNQSFPQKQFEYLCI
jgi:hypothetical protein